MLDSGCTTIVVKDSLLPPNCKLGKLVRIDDWLGIPKYFPEVRCFIKSKFFSGWTRAVAAPIKFADVLIGLVPGVTVPNHLLFTGESFENENEVMPPQSPSMSFNDPMIDSNTIPTSSTKPIDNQVCANCLSTVERNDIAMIVQTRASSRRKTKHYLSDVQ